MLDEDSIFVQLHLLIADVDLLGVDERVASSTRTVGLVNALVVVDLE